MENLIIDTRVMVAKRNLRRIEELETTLADQAKDLHKVLELPDSWLRELNDISGLVNDLLRKARDYSRVPDTDDQDPYAQLTNLRDAIEVLDRKIDGLYTRSAPTASDATRLHRELREFREYVEHSRDIRGKLIDGAERAHVSLTSGNYFDLRDKIEAFFAEYVDLLRAFALRNAGFTENTSQLSDIFFIADEMPRLWGDVEGWEWNSLTVPAYAELNEKSEAMMLRLGFPEWTLWALPFIQNQFAHVFLEERKNRFPGWAADCDTALLADALATVVTGPAYACAALLLRLDPASVTGTSSIEALRSATIIHSLELATAGQHTPFEKLVKRLKAEWGEAVGIAKGNPAAFEDAMKDLDVDRAARAAIKALPGKNKPSRPTWADQSGLIAGWANALRQGTAINLQDVPKSAQPIALGFLLNAAWFARVGPVPDPAQKGDTASEPEPEWVPPSESELDDIAARAMEHMLRIPSRTGAARPLHRWPKVGPVQ